MKKIYSIALTLLAGVALTSCVEEKLTVFNPENITAQTLANIEGVTLDADGADVTTTYNAADFGLQAPASYTLYAVPSNAADAEPAKVTATIADGTIKIKQKDLNTTLLNLGAVADTEFSADFYLMAFLCNDKGAAVAGTEVKSNTVTAVFTPYSADLLDKDVYDHIWIIGSAAEVGAWAHDKVYQFLYNYNKDGKTFEGTIDYGTGAADGWKLTGIAGWDDSCNWGSEAQAEDAEPASVTLISSGGSKDIKCYSKRFYKWSFDKDAMVLTKVYGFDNVGIVGTFNSWKADDANCKMEYNAYYHRFYKDYTFSDDSKLKFTCDDTWDLNWGVDCVNGGDDIDVKAGSYRVYLDLNKMEYSFSTAMYGKDEPAGDAGNTEPEEPETYEGWGIIGVGGDWDNDIAMSEKDGVWTGYASLTTSDSFKLRKDAAWTENYGGVCETLGTAFTAVPGGDNITVPADGFYKIVLNTNDTTITITESEVWSLIGAFNNWGGDVDMELVDGKWVSPATKISGEFKIRYNHAWGVNRGGAMEEIGKEFAAVDGGDNIKIETEAEYIVTYDPAAETILVETALPKNCWSLIGNVGSSSWNQDFYMTETMPGLWVSDPVVLAGEFKIRFDNGWGVNRGGSCTAADALFEVTQEGSNISPVVAGNTYVVTYYATAERISIHDMTTGWSLIGTINGTSWNVDVPMIQVSDGVYSATCKVNSEVKLRYAAGWDINFGGDFAEFGTAFTAVADGNNIKLDEGYYTITLDTNASTIVVRKAWSLIGGVYTTGWGADYFMVNDANGNYVAYNASLDGEWKLRFDAAWEVNRGGAFAELGTAFAVENNGANIATPGEGLYNVVYNPTAETVTVTSAL